VAKFKHVGTTLTDQNCMHEQVKSRLNSRNACYHSVQSLLSSLLLSRNVKVKIYKTIIGTGDGLLWWTFRFWRHEVGCNKLQRVPINVEPATLCRSSELTAWTWLIRNAYHSCGMLVGGFQVTWDTLYTPNYKFKTKKSVSVIKVMMLNDR
jgi:hypothetical protein